jgi:hypothetical protein
MEYPHMAGILSPAESDKFALHTFTITREEAKKYRMMSAFSSSRRDYYDLEEGDYCRLTRKAGGNVVMSDTPMEKRTNFEYLWRANGDVLQVGLGLGMTLVGIAKKPEVQSILVVELEQEIIDMVWHQINKVPEVKSKCTYVVNDIFKQVFPPHKKWDTIYFDIWDDITEDNWEEMKWLRRRYGRRLNRANEKCWMSCWRSDDCKPKKDTGWWN